VGMERQPGWGGVVWARLLAHTKAGLAGPVASCPTPGNHCAATRHLAHHAHLPAGDGGARHPLLDQLQLHQRAGRPCQDAAVGECGLPPFQASEPERPRAPQSAPQSAPARPRLSEDTPALAARALALLCPLFTCTPTRELRS